MNGINASSGTIGASTPFPVAFSCDIAWDSAGYALIVQAAENTTNNIGSWTTTVTAGTFGSSISYR
jgi:hypothetical protein